MSRPASQLRGEAVVTGREAIRVMTSMRTDPLRTMDEVVAAHGGVVRMRIPGPDYVLVADPDAIEQVLKPPDPDRMHKGQAIQRVKRILGDGLLTNDGEDYLRRRRLAQPAFQPRRLDAYVATMARHAADLRDCVSPGETFHVDTATDRMALRVAGEAMFGVAFDAEREQGIAEALEVVRSCFVPGLHPLAPVLEHFPLPIVRRFERSKRFLVDTVDWIIAGRHADPTAAECTDLLSLLLAARDDDGTGYGDTELRDEALVLLLAGHETTANALAWTLYLLAADPDAQARLHARVGEVLGERTEVVADDLDSLELVRAAFLEALRLFPSGSVLARRTLEPLALRWTDQGGEQRAATIAAGAELMVSQWVPQRDPARWGDDAATFRPERMLGSASDRRHRYSYLAFGGGRRVCIGRAFALQLATIALATFLARWRVELPEGVEPPTRDGVEIGFTLRPRGGMRLVAHERRSSIT